MAEDKKTPGPGNYKWNEHMEIGNRSTLYATMKGRHESLDAGS